MTLGYELLARPVPWSTACCRRHVWLASFEAADLLEVSGLPPSPTCADDSDEARSILASMRSLLSQSQTPTPPRRAVGFFRFGCPTGRPAELITQSTSDRLRFISANPFDHPFASVHYAPAHLRRSAVRAPATLPSGFSRRPRPSTLGTRSPGYLAIPPRLTRGGIYPPTACALGRTSSVGARRLPLRSPASVERVAGGTGLSTRCPSPTATTPSA